MATRKQSLFANAMRNSRVALASYQYGWPIDKERQRRIASEIDEELEIADASLQSLVPDAVQPFNPDSPKQVSHLLYDILELSPPHKTKTGAPATDKAALTIIAQSGIEPAASIAAALKARKVLVKLRQSYIDNLADVDIIRPQAHVTAQLSGRWSYRAPALQTTPARIKPMFVAHPGCYLVACDLSQAELRNMAQLSGCREMLDAYTAGDDIHARTAMAAFGCSKEEGKEKRFRAPAKVIILGYHYSVLDDQAAAGGLHAQLISKWPDVTVEKVLGIIRRMRAARPEVRAHKERSWHKAQTQDYVDEPLTGRRRKFWGRPKDTDAFNFPCQAMTAAIVDRAIQGVDSEFAEREGLLLQRHDEIIIGGPDLYRLLSMSYRHMRQRHEVRGNAMVYEVELEVGNRWGEGMATIEPHPSPKILDVDEVKCAVTLGSEKVELTGLRSVAEWISARIPPA